MPVGSTSKRRPTTSDRWRFLNAWGGKVRLDVSRLGDVAYARGQYEQAEAHYQALEIFDAWGGKVRLLSM